MSGPVERWMLPAFLLACLLVGGSTQNAWGVAVLLWAALAILAWSFSAPSDDFLTTEARRSEGGT